MNQTQSSGSFESIPLEAIRPSSTNPRRNFDETALNELAASIGEAGVTQPILVRPIPNPADIYIAEGYEIVSGERRFRAAKLAGLEEIPAFVRELDDRTALEIQMIENLQRADLHPMEEAEGYRALMAGGSTAEDVARKAGKTLGYVQQRLRLLTLEIDAIELFSAGHLSLDHALLLARLTPVDQERALRYLLRLDGDYARRPIAEAIQQRQRNHTSYTPLSRMVTSTGAELRAWISSHVLLQLKGVPWDLNDAELVPIAGPCTTCPKRTGANVALFADLTTATDTCTDPACFATKQAAYTRREQMRAKDIGQPLLKISAKRSTEKLAEPVAELAPGALAASAKTGQKTAPTVKAVVVAKKTVREGQWVAAKKGECPLTVQAIFVDGEKTGRTSYVCADQACKVHKHTVDRPTPPSVSRTPVKLSPEADKLAAAKRAWEEKKDRYVTVAILREVVDDGRLDTTRVLREVAAVEVSGAWSSSAMVAQAFDLKLPGGQNREESRAQNALSKYIAKATPGELLLMTWMCRQLEEDEDAEGLAKSGGLVDPSAHVRAAEERFERENPQPAAPAPAKAAEKKVFAKGQRSKPKKLSAASRERIAAAMKKRWEQSQPKKPAAIDGKSAAAGATVEARA
jgi:ParB/RepB/Spo0J family partition protein